MATTKKANAAKKKGGSKKRKNSATASGSSTRKVTTRKANPAKRVSKKNSARAKRNPFNAAGLNLMELGAAGLAAIGSQAIVNVFANPTSYLGIGLGIAIAVAVAKAPIPKSVHSAATVGAGVVPVVNLINRVTNNTIGNTITNTLRGFVPAGWLGSGNPATAPAAATGMAGYPRRMVNGQAV